jgi:hypothetical protein
VLVEELDPEEVEFAGVGFVGRHEVGVEADCEVRFSADSEDPQILNILQAGVDGHVEVVTVLDLHLLQLLVEFLVLLALAYDVCLRVVWMLQGLLEKTHSA